jgi:hypothetical protein
MSFRKLFAPLLPFVLSFIHLGCALEYGEPRNEPEVIELSMGDSACLSRSQEVFSRFLEGKADQKEIESVRDCTIGAIDTFKKRTRGEVEGQYHKKELLSFLEKYFLGGEKIPHSLSREAMLLKAAFLGGNEQVVTQDELIQTRFLIEALAEEAITLLPHLPLLPENVSRLSGGELTLVSDRLSQSAKRIGQLIQTGGSPYRFEDGYRLFTALSSSARSSAFQKTMSWMIGERAVVEQAFELLLGVFEWRDVLERSSNLYSLVLQWRWLQDYEGSLLLGDGLEVTEAFGLNLFSILEQAAKRQPGQVITEEKMKNLLRSLGSKRVQRAFGENFSLDSVELFLEPLFARLLGRAGSYRPIGLYLDTVLILKKDFQVWLSRQRSLESLFKGRQNQAISYSTFEKETKKGKGVKEIEWLWDNELSAFLKIRNKIGPIFLDNFSVDLSRLDFKSSFSFFELTQLNWMQLGIRQLFQGYIEDPKRLKTLSGLTQDEMQRLYADIRGVCIERGVCDPESDESGAARFVEADLFMGPADGNGLLDPEETLSLLIYLISSKKVADRLHLDVSTSCETQGLDRAGRPVVERECYEERLFSQFHEIFENMPQMINAYKALNLDEKREFERDLIRFAFEAGEESVWMSSLETDRISTVLHYIESFFFRKFDSDQSGVLETPEAMAAYPVFKIPLEEAVEEYLEKNPSMAMFIRGNEDMYRVIFAFILKEGRLPRGFRDLASWPSDEKHWEINVCRRSFLNTFVSLLESDQD